MTATIDTTTELHFRLEGPGLVRIIRDLVFEGRADHAARILVEGLHGIGYDGAYAVLDGSKTLEGDEHGMDLVDEDPEVAARHHARLLDVFGRRFTEDAGASWWEPYAMAESFGEPDAMWAMARGRQASRLGRTGQSTGWGPAGWTVIRALYYADNPDADDLCWRESTRRSVLVRKVYPPPSWYARARTTTLEDACSRTLLERRGHAPLLLRGAKPAEPPEPPMPAHPTKRSLDRVAREEAEAEAEAVRYNARLQIIQAEVAQRAGPQDGDGWIALHVTPKDAAAYDLRVPRAPFEAWALERTPARVDYTPVAPSGLKLCGDSAAHSDWMLGAGLRFDRDYDYNSPVQDAACALRHTLQRERLSWQVSVLSGQGRIEYGHVVHLAKGQVAPRGSVAVISVASPDYDGALSASAIITETGGRLAHLAQLATERGVLMVRQPGARDLYPVGVKVTVDGIAGKIEADPFLPEEP